MKKLAPYINIIIAIFILWVGFSVYKAHAAINPKTYIPPQAFDYKETIYTELQQFFIEIPDYNYVPSLIEHESCISLTHSKCWNPKSRLKTSREEGAGLGQVTKAYRPDGSLRFDTLTDLRTRYKNELKELSWDNVYTRPDLQIRSMILLIKESYQKLYNIVNPYDRLAMTDSAYNGGLNDVFKARRACGLSSSCNSKIWFKNVELFSPKSTKVLYGTRSSKDINLHHVKDVMTIKLPKYQNQYFNGER